LNNRATEILETTMGNLGSKAITGTSAVTPTAGFVFTCIQAMEDSAVTTQTDSGITNAVLSSYTTIISGTMLYGRWSSITPASGSFVGYLGR